MVASKYNGLGGVRGHILRMNDMVAQLKAMDMEISEGFLVHFIITSLLSQFGPFKINYNTQKEKWKMSEPISMCDQEEGRLKAETPDSAHFTTQRQGKKQKLHGKDNRHVKKNNDGNKTKTSGVGFRFMRKLNKGEHNVLVGNGNKVPIESVGTLPLVLESGFKLNLLDTVYVPSITRNLISIS
ncbi:hypothetical protein ZIOFF_011605 [Zingiber officinale]|uniref:Retrovirus-related Pol polyprotein from transposon TNT 1-94-like beta-barrel domain-containing protein n=1 Tax=Zingiber officinale TaxID=94328 RepID=A0A8J5HYH0_ZINOF|nr:hypothetical protein ZIOFF_011605 [Zingiber officinale]